MILFRPLSFLLILSVDVLSVYSVYFPINGPWWKSWVTPLLPFYLLFLLLFLVGCLLLRQRKLSVLAGASAVLILVMISPVYWSVLKSSSQVTGGNMLSVMNYNVSFFHTRGNYTEAYDDPQQNPTSVAMIDWLENQSPDVIGLQEFYDDTVSVIYNVRHRMKAAGYKYHHFINNPRVLKPRKRGLIIFSKWPIINHEKIHLSSNRFNGVHYVDILWKNDTVRIINLHLESSQLAYLPRRVKSSGWMNKLKWKYSSLRNTTIARNEQSRLVMDYASGSPYPTVIAGDFNSQSYSGLVKQFISEFDHAHLSRGTGMLYTYYGDNLWPVGIDHQFYNDGLIAQNLMILKDIEYSPHRPVVGFYSLKAP